MAVVELVLVEVDVVVVAIVDVVDVVVVTVEVVLGGIVEVDVEVDVDVLVVVAPPVMVSVPATGLIAIVSGPLCASTLAGVNVNMPLALAVNAPTLISRISP